MGVTGIGIGIGIGPFDLSKPSGSALDVITSSNGAWWVVKERDGSNNLVDQTGGGRHLFLPGGSANPVLLDHTGTDYFWFPGTASNTLTTSGLSNSTAYDYKVWYLDGSTATGQETTDGSGVLTLGGTQTNFNVKKVTRIRVVADGADPDVATAVRDMLASDADPDATTFTEASSNAATVTINRSSTGYKTAVVDQPKYVTATDDYMTTASSSLFQTGASEDVTIFWVGCVYGTAGSSALANAGSGLRLRLWTSPEYASRAVSGATVTDVSSTGARGAVVVVAARLDRTAQELEVFVNGVGTGSPEDASGVGAISASSIFQVGVNTTDYVDAEHIGAAFIKQALSDADILAVGNALITANGGTP